jgi:predicted nucleic acid-binding protein
VIVVDTNVIAYLWIPGVDTERAERLYRDDPEWCAPLLWRSQLRSVLAGYLRRGRISVATAIRIAEAAEELTRGREFEVSSERVIDAVARSRCSAYDCEFVALAEELAVPLVTSDRRILSEFPRVATSLARARGGQSSAS